MKTETFSRAMLLAGASLLVLANPALATDYQVPAGDLKAALHAYAMQARVQIIVADEAVRGARTKGVTGEYSADAALSRILAGTGLVMHRHESGAIALVREENEKHSAKEPVVQLAEAAAPSHAASSVETVVVTSSKIKGDIQTVPIAITALSQEQLTTRQIAGGPDLVKEVPNLTFSKTNFTGYNIEIRGIGTQAISVTTDPAVAVAFNDTPFIRNHFFEQEFYDVAQVEVLRGPQGTLYGRNATAGVVNVVSAKPTDQFEAMLSADWGNYHNRRYEGMVNLPIVGDKLALRIAGEWTKRDGYSFNQTTNQPIDGRDLWSTRATLGWKPTSDIEADLIWEHFSENDDRLRSGKQLCKTDPGPQTLTAADGTVVDLPPANGDVFGVRSSNFSQGCLPDSLYDKGHPNATPADYGSYGVPNGWSLPFLLGASFESLINNSVDPYAQTKQSTNLRNIQSAIEPRYIAKNDTLEFNASWNVTPSLTFYSDTSYNNDFLWSTEDYDRFDTSPGIFQYPYGGGGGLTGVMSPDPNSSGGIFCDPQLGCSDRLIIQDLAEEHSWQFGQEFRLQSDFGGPLNFSAGANYMHYVTSENYYVFSNVFTLLSLDNICYGTNSSTTSPYISGVTTQEECLPNGRAYNYNLSLADSVATESPQYIDPNPITNLDNNGHNYFVSQNPYTLNSYATFGEIYYNLTKDLKLTAGLRWTGDAKSFKVIPSEVIVRGYGYSSLGNVDQSWSQGTGRFVANWTPKLSFTDQTMVYASYARGYKAGGENPPGAVFINADVSSAASTPFPVHPASFKPEFVDAFEIGTKNALLGGGLTLNGDVFFYNYKGYQISQIVDRTSVNLNFDAKVKGAELEATYEPFAGLKFSFAGGYEDTRINDGQYAIDLMDRTAGHAGWIVMKPSAGEASNCIFPAYVGAALAQAFPGGGEGNPAVSSCGFAYAAGVDPITGLSYKESPTITANDGAGRVIPPNYPGYDPLSVDPTAPADVNNGLGLPPNNGEGFAKNVGGNELPNAPHFTASFTADYTIPVSANWAVTLHGDFYWQSQSWARVFNDNPYDKIRGYSNVNAALILTDASGWQVMGYVKNIFDTTAITGDFLNSDDTGLTTNVFLTDPRLYGVRVTKHFDGGDSSGGFDLFSNGDGKRPQIWLTLGGNYALLQDNWQKFNPSFASGMPAGLPNPVSAEEAPSATFDWQGELTYQPEDSDWVLKAGIRYGRSSHNRHLHKSLPALTARYAGFTPYIAGYLGVKTLATCASLAKAIDRIGGHVSCPFSASIHEFVDAQTSESERHTILDFVLGKDVGLGLFNGSVTGTVSAGVRVAQFGTRAYAHINSDPHDVFPTFVFYPFGTNVEYHDVYDSTTQEKRSFHGIGPEITWDAQQPVWGNEADGQIAIDWGVNAAVLFGEQRVNIHQTQTGLRCMSDFSPDQSFCTTPLFPASAPTISRSRSVTVPNLGGYAGVSLRYNAAQISLGYRADEFFNAMDGGQSTAKKYDRGFYGPYLNLSIGFGG